MTHGFGASAAAKITADIFEHELHREWLLHGGGHLPASETMAGK